MGDQHYLVKKHSLSSPPSALHHGGENWAVATRMLRKSELSHKDSSVPVGNFPTEAKTSRHDSPLKAVVIVGMSKAGTAVREEEVAHCLWVRAWGGVLSAAEFQARHSPVSDFPPKARPQDSMRGALSSFYSSGQRGSWFGELRIRILFLENWFVKAPGGYD